MIPEPSATLAITARANALRAQGVDVIAFTAGEPDLPTPKHICEAAKAAIDAGLHKYTPTEGAPELRQAIREKLTRENGLADVEIIATAGGKQAIMEALLALCEPGDEVLIPVPSWLSYTAQATLADAVPVLVPEATAAAIEKCITLRSRVLILSSPGNPTGSVIPQEEIARIAALADKHGLWVVSDEVYEHLVFEGTAACVRTPRTIVIGSCSKTYAMTGWRIGWAAGPKEVIRKMIAIQSHMTSGPSSIAQAAAVAALTGPQECVAALRDSLKARRSIMTGLLDDAGITYVRPDGAFYVFMDIGGTKMTSEEFAQRLLDEQRVAVIPGKPFGDDTHVRLSYACPEDSINEGVGRIKRFMEAHA